MQPENLFGMALGIVHPWEVTEVRFSKEANRLDIMIDFKKGSTFLCPVCGASSVVYDTSEKTWRHLNFFQYEAYLHARIPRIDCGGKDCGVKQVQVPWARQGSGFTLLFEALVMTMSREMPINVIARLHNVNDKRLWRIIDAYIQQARSKESFKDVKHLGIDETSVKKGKKGKDFISFFFDLDRRKLLFGTEGKDSNTVNVFVDDFKSHGGDPEKITDVAIDMSKAFIKGVEEQLPNAEKTFDKFHVIKLMNEVLSEVRAAEAKQFPEALRNSRYLFLRNHESLSPDEVKKIDEILENHCHKTLEAYTHKLNLQNVYLAESRLEAETLLTRWHANASKSELRQIRKMAKTIKKHWDGILNHFDSMLTSGFIEGINSLIQAAKARARGYRNPRNMISIAYLIAGKLKFNGLYSLPT